MRQNGSIMEIFHNFFNNSENEIIFYDLSEEIGRASCRERV